MRLAERAISIHTRAVAMRPRLNRISPPPVRRLKKIVSATRDCSMTLDIVRSACTASAASIAPPTMSATNEALSHLGASSQLVRTVKTTHTAYGAKYARCPRGEDRAVLPRERPCPVALAHIVGTSQPGARTILVTRARGAEPAVHRAFDTNARGFTSCPNKLGVLR
eukprot:1037523-Prymnesium_polylepis.1